jgi:hypothetical protein
MPSADAIVVVPHLGAPITKKSTLKSDLFTSDTYGRRVRLLIYKGMVKVPIEESFPEPTLQPPIATPASFMATAASGYATSLCRRFGNEPIVLARQTCDSLMIAAHFGSIQTGTDRASSAAVKSAASRRAVMFLAEDEEPMIWVVEWSVSPV